MKAHPQREKRVQGKQFRGIPETATPPFLPKVTACCRKPKIHRDSALVRAVWSIWAAVYFYTASVHAPAIWAHLIPSSQRGIVSSHTPPPHVLAVLTKERLQQAGSDPRYGGSTKEMQRLFLLTPGEEFTCWGELEGQVGWRMQDVTE